MTPALELIDISKQFGDIRALRRASLLVRPGTVHALLGENGAGKTTLMRVAYGLTVPDSGTIRRQGVAHTPRHPSDAIRLGIGMVHQHFSLVPAMTVAENVVLGLHGAFRAGQAADLVRDVARSTGLQIDPGQPVRTLSVSAQQRVEILKALVRNTKVLVLDEPTAVLAPREADDLLTWIRAFAAAPDHCAVLITHKLREALAIADDVTVLRAGEVVLSQPADRTDETMLVRAMIGGDVEATALAVRRPAGSPVISLRQVTVEAQDGRLPLHDVSVEIGQGELVGVAAVEGSGQHELLRVMAGRLTPTRGTAAIPSDIGFIPEDRQRDAVVLEMTLTENLALRGLAARRGRMPWTRLGTHAQQLIGAFDVHASGPRALLSSLSGGNQQRFVVGRELDPLPAALIVENPTRGLDIRAAASVHDRLRAARDAGTAIVMYSSDVDEVLALADRVLVVYGGVVRTAPPVRDVVGRAMLGVVDG